MKYFPSFPPNSRIWVYQSNRPFADAEVNLITAKGNLFTDNWTAHQQALHAAFEIIGNRFIVFCVDENSVAASGCSIDKSVHFVKEMEKELNIFLLNRMLVAYKNGDEIISCPLNTFTELYKEGKVNLETIVFNNTVTTLEEFNNAWEIPLKQSWMMSQLMDVHA